MDASQSHCGLIAFLSVVFAMTFMRRRPHNACIAQEPPKERKISKELSIPKNFSFEQSNIPFEPYLEDSLSDGDDAKTRIRKSVLMSKELAAQYVDSSVSRVSVNHMSKMMAGLPHSPSLLRMVDVLSQRAELIRGPMGLPGAYRRHYEALQDYDFDPRECPDAELMEMALAIFYCYNLPEKMAIPDSNLRAFVKLVHSLYKPPGEVIFHNFKHVYNVMHIAFHILRSGPDECFTTFDVFALFVSALCHDIDHPGVNNAFMVSSRSDIAGLYSNDAVLERHHSYVTRKILLSGPESFPIHDSLCGM